MSKAQEIGQMVGYAIARDTIADGLPREWSGLSDQDGDLLTAAGIEPDTDEWDEAERAARRAYEILIGRSAEEVIVNELDGSTFHTTDVGSLSDVMGRSDDRLKSLIFNAIYADDGIAQDSWEEDGEEFCVKVIVR